VVSVEQWAEVRRMHFVDGLGIREIRRRTGLDRETIRRALRCSSPPVYSRPAPGSKLDSFKEEVHALLRSDPEMESQRIREILMESGFDGGKTITDDYVREVRPYFRDQRTYQRTVYRPGELLQFDLWQPRREIPVGYGQTRKGYVVVGVSRLPAGLGGLPAAARGLAVARSQAAGHLKPDPVPVRPAPGPPAAGCSRRPAGQPTGTTAGRDLPDAVRALLRARATRRRGVRPADR
jgi:hypothetical protein